MIRTFTVLPLALLFVATAHAEPLRLGDAQMDGITAGQSAKNPYYAITGDTATNESRTTSASHPAFQPTGKGSVGHVRVPELRFGSGGAIAIPGNGNLHANPNSAFNSPYLRPPGHN